MPEQVVLIVDDEESIRWGYSAILQGEGFRALTAASAAEARGLLQREPCQVLVVDVLLSGTTGLDLLQKVRAERPDLPVIMVTGRPTVENAALALRLEAFDYLVKPVNKSELLRSVRKALLYKELLDKKRDLEQDNERHRRELEQRVEQRTRELEQANRDLQQKMERLRRVERSLRESEAHLRDLFDHAPMGSAMVAPDYRFRRVNAELSRITGYQAEALLQLGLSHIIWPDDLSDLIWELRRLEDGEKELARLDLRCLDKQGRQKRVRLWVRLLSDEEGQPRYFLLLFEDMEHTRRLQDELRLLRCALDQGHEAVMLCNGQGRLVYANQAAAALLGREAAALQDSSLTSSLAPRELQRLQSEIWPQVAQGRTWQGHWEWRLPEGGTVRLQGRCARLENGEDENSLGVNKGGLGHTILYLQAVE